MDIQVYRDFKESTHKDSKVGKREMKGWAKPTCMGTKNGTNDGRKKGERKKLLLLRPNHK